MCCYKTNVSYIFQKHRRLIYEIAVSPSGRVRSGILFFVFISAKNEYSGFWRSGEKILPRTGFRSRIGHKIAAYYFVLSTRTE
jgi:hypothetical protein